MASGATSRAAARRVLQPVSAAPGAWSWGQFVISFAPAGVGAVAVGLWERSVNQGVVWLALLVVVTIAVLAFRAVYVLQKELEGYGAKPRPHIVIGEAEIADAHWVVLQSPTPWHAAQSATAASVSTASVTSHSGLLPFIRTFQFGRVKVANLPPPDAVGETATDVVARIIFISENRGPVVTIDGRWAKTPQAPNRQSFVHEFNVPIDLPSNGRFEALDVVMKDPTDGTVYAFNDLNAQFAPDDARYEFHRLPDPTYKVVVCIRPGNDVETTEEFRLDTRPKLKLGRPDLDF